jgi:hypothetical protein
MALLTSHREKGWTIVVEIHLYGKLRQYNGSTQAGHDSVLLHEADPDETLAGLLEEKGIPVEEINHIFLNAKLLSTRTAMGKYYGYQQVGDSLDEWDLAIPVSNGDRLGLFGKDMAILGM